MKLSVSPNAAKWYKQEMDLQDGDHIQFMISLYGHSIHPNYSLTIAKESPQDIAYQSVVEGITFYFEKQDAWFLDGYRLNVTMVDDEIEFIYEKTDD